MQATRLIAIAALFVAGAPASFAGLVWESTRVEATASPGQGRFEALFPFKNSGDKSVTITSTETSCGCTAARLPKFTYAPGEPGVLRAVFEFGDRVGPQQKVVTVTTDDGANATHLVLRIDIPALLALDRETLQWVVGARPEPLSAEVTVARGVRIGALEFDSNVLAAEIQADNSAPEKYRIVVTPRSVEKPFRQVIRLHAEFAGKPRVVPLYISVR